MNEHMFSNKVLDASFEAFKQALIKAKMQNGKTPKKNNVRQRLYLEALDRLEIVIGEELDKKVIK
jgi:hypothetical protein